MVSGTSDSDSIYNTGNNVTISGGGNGKDTLWINADNSNNVESILADGGAGDDSITNSKQGEAFSPAGSYSFIDAGDGNDYVENLEWTDYSQINGGDGNDIIIDYTEDDIIQFTSGTASVKKSGKNVIFTLGKGKITVTGGASKVITYTDSTGEHTYPEVVKINDAGTKITVLESYMKDTFNSADYGEGFKTITAAAVTHDLSINGNKLSNKIYGGFGNDTLTGGKGNDSLKGGSGSDIFVYADGDGNDLITDYAEEDKIKIASGTAKVIKSGSNVIFTVGSGKITVKGAASKTVTCIDKNGKTKYFPKKPTSDIILTDNNTTAILRETYSESTYTAGSSIKKIDASSVTHNIKITGNGKANQILGGYENDTILGGKGNDTIYGGSGADVFVYANGDGKDIILDYVEEDKIQITKGTAQVAANGNDVVFTIGSGKITVLDAADKTVSYVEGGKTKTYGNSASNVLEDDNFITGNDLSAIVESKAVDYAFAKMETQLTASETIQTLTYSSKK